MKHARFTVVLFAAVGMWGLVPCAYSSSTLAPTQLLSNGEVVIPSDSPQYVLDGPAPVGASVGGAPGYGPTSWYSDAGGAGTSRPYSDFRIIPSTNVTDLVLLSELDNIIYDTNWVGGSVDWRVSVYLAPARQPVNSGDPWYSYRLNFKRGSDLGVGDLGDGWDEYSINALGLDYVTAWTPTGLQNSYAYTWDQFKTLFALAPISFIDLGAGYQTDGPASYSYLDGVRVNFSNRSDIELDLVPEPISMVMLGCLGGGMALARKLRRKAA